MFGLFRRKKETGITPVYYPNWWRDTDEYKETMQRWEDSKLSGEIRRMAIDFAYYAAQRPAISREKFGMGFMFMPPYRYTIHHEETAKYKDSNLVYSLFKEEATRIYEETVKLFP